MNLKIKDKKLLANFLSIITILVCFLVLATSRQAIAAAGTNQQISFQGKIVKSDNTNINDGTYNMEFKIYQDGNSSGTGSTLKWTEDYLVAGSSGMPSTGGVSIAGGTFQVSLGSICALTGGVCGAKTNTAIDFNQQTLWLSIQIGNTSSCTVTSTTTSFNTACGGDGEMTPFIRLTSVPQAMNADTLDGIDSTTFVQLGGSQSGNINIGASGILKLGTIDTPLTNQALGIGTSNAGVITMGNVTNSTFLIKTKSIATAIQIQNGSGFNVVGIDTSANHLKVYDGTATQGYVDIYYDDGTSSAIIAASSGTTKIGSGTGSITINSGAGAATDITGNAASTFKTTAGNLTIDSGGGTLVLGTSTTTVQRASTSLTLDLNNASASTFTVTNAGAGNITLALESGGSFAVGASTGSGVTCSGGQVLQNQVVVGGITTGGSCVTAGGSLQNAYDASSSPATITQTAAKSINIAAGAAPSADQFIVTNSGFGTSTTGVDGAYVNFSTAGTTASADNAGLRIDVTSNNSGATTTLEGLAIGNLSSAEANSTETGISVGTGWDIGLNLQSGGIQMAETGNPSAPASNNILIYAKDIAGRTMLKAMPSSGVDYAYQPSLFQQSILLITPGNNTTATSWTALGGQLTAGGTLSMATTTEAQGFMGNVATATTAGTGAGVSNATAQYYRGSGGNNADGYFFFARVNFPGTLATYTNTTSGARFFAGLSSTIIVGASGMTSSDSPTGSYSGIQYAPSANANNFTFITRDGTTTHRTDTGVALAVTKTYDIYIYCKPGDTSISWRIDNLTDGTAPVEGTETNNLPAATTAMLSGVAIAPLNTTADNIRIQRIYTETDR